MDFLCVKLAYRLKMSTFAPKLRRLNTQNNVYEHKKNKNASIFLISIILTRQVIQYCLQRVKIRHFHETTSPVFIFYILLEQNFHLLDKKRKSAPEGL